MFNNIVGNEKIKQILEKSVKLNNVSHSYLFVGTEGIGKKLVACEFAKMFLCLDEHKYCDNCKSCIEFNTDNHPDFELIEPDGNSLKIDQIREFQVKVTEKPIISEKKVYIINDSDKMTVEAQNCLLKTLEEPPEFAIIILIGQNESSFLSTIKSRCMILNFNKITNVDLRMYLEKNCDFDVKSDIMLEAFQGSIGKALRFKDRKVEYEQIEQIIYSMKSKDIIDVVNMSDIIYNQKNDKSDVFNVLDYMNVVFINLARNESRKYAYCIGIVEETKKRLKSNANFNLNIDNMLFDLYDVVH